MMERSAKFISLSGLAGVMAGLYALLASAYADAAIAFARDLPGPLQILELGGGVGRLAFNLMRELEARGVWFQYRFTDASRANSEAAANHPQLRPT